ncbi:MAG: DUF992 domain-containing protein [Mariprofundaceae bacterium]
MFVGLLLCVLFCPAAVLAAEPNLHRIGTLNCRTIPHSGMNLLIHSTKGVRCAFIPATNAPIKHYKGETGIGFGLDVNINHSDDTSYAVLANRFAPATQQLAGKYEGAKGSASFGLTVGDNAPISKTDGSISLQPVNVKTGGISAAAGFSYLYLKAEDE